MEIITQLVIMAFLVEAVWETLKMTWQDGKCNIDRIGALFMGILIAFTLNVDLFKAIGLDPIYNIVGVILSGILISRGGNFIHDLFNRLNQKEVR